MHSLTELFDFAMKFLRQLLVFIQDMFDFLTFEIKIGTTSISIMSCILGVSTIFVLSYLIPKHLLT